MNLDARWYVITVILIFLLCAPTYGLVETMSIESIPGVWISVYAGEFRPVIENSRQLSDANLRARIDALKKLVRGGGDESSREPKIEMLAAFVILRERRAISAEEGEQIISLALSDPSIVAEVTVDFSQLRSVVTQLDNSERQLRDEQQSWLESRPAWKRLAVQASGIHIGWLYTSLDEDHLKPGQTTELTITFVPLASTVGITAGVSDKPIYALKIAFPNDDPRFTTALRPGDESIKNITQANIARSATWHFRVTPSKDVPDKVLLKPQVSLNLQDALGNVIPKEELPAKELELYLYRKPDDPIVLPWWWTAVAPMITGVVVFLVTSTIQGKKDRKKAIERVADELEFNLALVTKNPSETSDILLDLSGRELTFLPKDLKDELNQIHERVSRAKKTGESLKNKSVDSSQVELSEIEDLFGKLRESIPPLLHKLQPAAK